MSRLPQLRQALLEAAERQAPQARSTGRGDREAARWWLVARRVPAGILAALGLLTVAGVAFAASQLIQTGAPVQSRLPPLVRAGVGVAIPRSEGLLGIAAPDPAGGPPWTMRVYDTSRGLGCVQVGRLVGGRIGALGEDGVFADDGRFHPLPTQTSQSEGDCVLLDGHDQTFLAMSAFGVSASGLEAACDPVSDRRPPPAGMQPCARADERDMFYGLLGPDARSITYTINGHTRTVPTVGRQGAYLIVATASRRSVDGGGAELPNVLPSGANPQQPIRSVAYTDGHTCTMTLHGNRDEQGRRCQPIGYVDQHVALPSARQLASPVLARRVLRTSNGKPSNELLISFTARVPVRNARSDYGVSISAPDGGPCHREGRSTGQPLDRDVRAGERLHFKFWSGPNYPGDLYTGCWGTYHGEVTYTVVSGGPRTGTSLSPTPPGLSRFDGTRTRIVGRFSYSLTRSQASLRR